MKKTVIAIFLLLAIPTSVIAQEISVDDLLGTEDNDEISQNVEDLEQERTEEIENELNISIPDYTDNPSHIITFTDPSEEDAGVELDIDESGYKEINSPYSLPSLRIGEHTLKFRFVDSIGATKVLEYDIVIIPRPPVVKAPQFNDGNLVISGTGLANSEVVLTVSVGANNYTQITEINGDGNWNTAIEMEDTAEGIYTIFGYTRKDGYASNPSEPAVFEYGDGEVVDRDNQEDSNISFDFSSIQLNDIPGLVAQNPDLLITIVSALLLGAIITTILFLLFNGAKSKEAEQAFSKKINGKPKEEKTLLELFGAEGEEDSKKKESKEEKTKKPKKEKKRKKSKKEKKDEKKTEAKEDKTAEKVESEEEKKKKEKIFTRHDFLKDFKKFDPDKDSGKETKEPTKRDKKDVVVTLTSPREEE